MPFPNFDPVLIHLGPLPVRWYALSYIAGLLLGWRYAVGLIRNPKLWTRAAPPATPVQFDDLMFWIMAGVIVGGRLGHVLFYTPEIIVSDPLEILKTWHGGMSFHGGALGVILAVAGYAAAHRIDMLRLGDVVAPAVPIGLGFGRLANFVNGELWGRPTALPWGIVFPGGGPSARHPSQLYEALLEGLVLFLLLRWATHKARWLDRRGVVTGLFLLGYAVFRIAVEGVREPDVYLPSFPFGLTMGMMLSAPMALGGLILIGAGLKAPPPSLAAHEPG